MDKYGGTDHVDLRVQRTYKLLGDAFVSLLSEKNFDQITVREICDRAMVRRTTFYQHFKDKQDFLVWFIRDKQKDFLRHAKYTGDPVSGIENYLTGILTEVLHEVREHRHYIDAVSGSAPESISPLKVFSDAWVKDVTVMLEKFAAQPGTLLPAPPAIAAEYYVGGVLSVARWWYISDFPCSEEELISHIRDLAHDFTEHSCVPGGKGPV